MQTTRGSHAKQSREEVPQEMGLGGVLNESDLSLLVESSAVPSSVLGQGEVQKADEEGTGMFEVVPGPIIGS